MKESRELTRKIKVTRRNHFYTSTQQSLKGRKESRKKKHMIKEN